MRNAYRKDLADVSLAGQVIASHYAEPLEREVTCDTVLLASPDPHSEPLAEVARGALIRMLDNSRGWVWAYGPDGQVGYFPSTALDS